jgi:muramoyltetrapeptide carboxypeptidase
MQPVKPQALRPGDVISVVAPAGPVARERIELAFARLQSRGYRIKTHGDVFRKQGYLAGDDQTRAAELMTAFTDPESTAVWCARGGYGVARILDRLDYDILRRHPKVFVGFSDITALHLALQNRTGLATFHGPNLQDGFGREDEMSPATEAALWRAIAPESIAGAEFPYTYAEFGTDGMSLRTVAPGVAQGRLTGGNLAVLAGLLGTPFEIETAGRILLLEDINEEGYRVDRYLAQLALAGKLRSLAGVALGDFSLEAGSESAATALVEPLHEYLGKLGVPVLAGLPAGHQRENWCLPINALVEVDADARRLRVLERPVTVSNPSSQ